MPAPLVYTRKEAAQALGISLSTLRVAIRAGEIPTVPASLCGNRVLIPRAALERRLAEIGQAS